MKTYIALLRGVNVGGNTVLRMADLTTVCIGIGLNNVRTYIQSGNILFESALSEKVLVRKLEEAIQTGGQKKIPVIIRTLKEFESVVSRNPFANAKPALVGVMFFSQSVPKGLLKEAVTLGPEEAVISGREIYIHYPNGMGRSKLKFPAMDQKGTVRNINTVTRLVQLGRGAKSD